MHFEISNKIKIKDCNNWAWEWIFDNLVVDNPTYITLDRLGKEDTIKWKHVPPKLNCYSKRGNDAYVPFGCLNALWPIIKKCSYTLNFNSNPDISLKYKECPVELYDYQQEAVDYMVKAKGGVLVSPCGSGKTFMGIEIIRRLGKRFLWLTHTKDLLNQTMKEFKGLYEDLDIGTITEGKIDMGKDGTISTIQTLSKIDAKIYSDYFDVVVVDECFPAGTLISTYSGYKKIEDIKINDFVYSYDEKNKKIELKKVNYLFKKKTKDLCKIKLSNDDEIVCTGNHPIYTKRGYIPAQEVKEYDYVMRMVPKRVRYFNSAQNNSKKKRNKRMGPLLYRVFEENFEKKIYGKYYTRKTTTKQSMDEKIECFPIYDGIKRKKKGYSFIFRTKRKIKSNGQAKKYKNSLSRREWKTSSSLSNEIVSSINKRGYRMRFRACGSNENEKGKWLSYLLQNRYCYSTQKNCYRGRWFEPFKIINSRKRQEERNIFEWIRVENIEIQKQTSDGTFGGMCENGYVYNIEVDENNNYFANNYLVHNCAHCAGSVTNRKMFQDVVEQIPARYKYGLTATPARSDSLIKTMYMILGTSKAGLFEPTFKIEKERVKTIVAEHVRYDLETVIPYDSEIRQIDGTIEYVDLINFLAENNERNNEICKNVFECSKEKRKQIVLCSRVDQCYVLGEKLKALGLKVDVVTGKVTKKARSISLAEDNNWDVLVATYSLLKEGISIKKADTLHLTAPIKDKSTIVQCVGRIERFLENKKQPIVYDYVDKNISYCLKKFTERKRYIKKRF